MIQRELNPIKFKNFNEEKNKDSDKHLISSSTSIIDQQKIMYLCIVIFMMYF